MKKLVLTALALTVSTALGHAELTALTPAENSTIAAPKMVSHTFGEGVELKFSTFKVYPLKASGDAQVMNKAADQLMARVISLKTDAAMRADTGINPSSGAATNVTLAMKFHLTPGIYEVMWKVLSVDTHASSGRYLFTVK